MKNNRYERHSNGEYIHRAIAESILNRELKITEVVHHIDGDHRNNEITNLMVCDTHSSHYKIHNGAVALITPNGSYTALKKIIISTCKNCGSTLEYFNYTKGEKQYCNIRCLSLARRKVKRPSNKLLVEQIKAIGFRGTGIFYNVSDNTIRKWCKKANLPTHVKYYK